VHFFFIDCLAVRLHSWAGTMHASVGAYLHRTK